MDAKLTVGSLYAGVGGICLGFKEAGFELAWANEWDSKACETYRTNFSHPLYEGDVMQLDPRKLEKVDVLTAGFPCQPFSVAGYRKGFTDSRGNHFFRIVEIAEHLDPKVMFLENVKNLVGHDDGKTFKVILSTLHDLGYEVFHKVLNTKDFGNVPHNRERIFIIGIRRDVLSGSTFAFPEKEELTKSVTDIIDDELKDHRFFYTAERPMFDELRANVVDKSTVYQWRRKYVRENKSHVCPTLTANMGTGGHNVPIVLTSQGIRKLTPKECFALQGFPVLDADGAHYHLPPQALSHLYKQAGNSVSVPVIAKLAKALQTTLLSGQDQDRNAVVQDQARELSVALG